MSIRTAVHRVENIKVKEIRELESLSGMPRTYVREITITDDQGQRFELTLFANEPENLIII